MTNLWKLFGRNDKQFDLEELKSRLGTPVLVQKFQDEGNDYFEALRKSVVVQVAALQEIHNTVRLENRIYTNIEEKELDWLELWIETEIKLLAGIAKIKEKEARDNELIELRDRVERTEKRLDTLLEGGAARAIAP